MENGALEGHACNIVNLSKLSLSCSARKPRLCRTMRRGSEYAATMERHIRSIPLTRDRDDHYCLIRRN